MKRICLSSMTLAAAFSLAACAKDTKLQQDAQTYLDQYATEYQKLYTTSQEAQWKSNTHIVPGDTTNATRTKAADEALAKFTGSTEAIETIRGFLAKKDQLTPIQIRQLEKMLYIAANAPQTVADVVKARIAAEAAQTETLYGYTFKIGGKPVTPNQIDSLLVFSTNLPQRLSLIHI